VVLLGFSAYFAYTIASGNLNFYINLRFAWLSYVAVVIFAALGISNLLALRDVNAFISARQMGGHADRSPSLITVMMVALPLTLGAATILTDTAQPLGVDAVNGVSLTSNFGSGFSSIAQKPPLSRDILDWSRVFAGESSPTVFNGQSAKLLGFVYTEPSYPDGRFMLARFTMSCCVADANALGLPAAYDGLDNLKAGDWVMVEGTFQTENFLGRQMPVLQVAKLESTTQPEQPYLYP
jgi:uncharacterized repeat protein (TIGR03943 family)